MGVTKFVCRITEDEGYRHLDCHGVDKEGRKKGAVRNARKLIYENAEITVNPLSADEFVLQPHQENDVLSFEKHSDTAAKISIYERQPNIIVEPLEKT